VSEVNNFINSYITDIVLTTPQSSPSCLADCFWSTRHTLPSPTLRGTTYFKSFGIIQFVCCRDSVYKYHQDSVQFSVGIKVFTKTRLRRDIIYSFEDLLGTPHLWQWCCTLQIIDAHNAWIIRGSVTRPFTRAVSQLKWMCESLTRICDCATRSQFSVQPWLTTLGWSFICSANRN
jgi:hypothetical protein